jgi:hypothetical protein
VHMCCTHAHVRTMMHGAILVQTTVHTPTTKRIALHDQMCRTCFQIAHSHAHRISHCLPTKQHPDTQAATVDGWKLAAG